MIPPSTLLSPLLWAEATFGSVQLGDPRRNRRAVAIAHAMATETGASLPKQLHDGAALEATYRFLHSGQVSYEDLIRPHVEATRQDCREHKAVLLIQDTSRPWITSSIPRPVDWDPLAMAPTMGFCCKRCWPSCLRAVRCSALPTRNPFCASLLPPKKPDSSVCSVNANRKCGNAVSRPWDRRLKGCAGCILETATAISFRSCACAGNGTATRVIRAAQDRCVDLLVEQAERPVPARSHHAEHPSPAAQHLFEVVESWPAQASSTVEIDASQKRKARTAKVLLSWQPLRVLPPRSQESHGWHPLVVWVIHVWEPEPPEGAEALEWVLLSSVPTQTFEDAQERVDWYRARWMVEDFHQGLKTGCQIEQRHLQDYEGLRTLLGLLAPMAVRLMQVRAASRQDPEQPASQVLPSDVVAVVAHLDHRPAETMTVQQCWHAIARSGGYLGRKSDGPPRVENPVARMAAYPNTARRRSSCTFAFSIKLVIQSQHQGPVYLISILENYSRAVLASKISPAQNQWDYLEVLFAAFSTAGVPKAIVSDGGGIFYCNQAMAVYQALGIEKERIAKKQA